VSSAEPRTGDAFGELLRRCWLGGGAPGVAHEVVERDDGFVSVRDAAWYFGRWPAWKPVEREAVALAKGRVADIGCGAGRHSLHLATAGHDVVGLEPSAGARDVAASRGVTVVEGSIMRPPAVMGPIDTFLLCGENLGLLGTPARAPIALAALARLARPGAQLLGTGIDPRHDPALRAYARANLDRGRSPGQQRLRIRSEALATAWFDYLYLSPSELPDIVAATPWSLQACEQDGMDFYVRLVLG
jgi:SAM-dependent methyltransferase